MNEDSKFGVNRQAQFQRGQTVVVTHSFRIPATKVVAFQDYYNDAFDQTANSISITENSPYDNYFGIFYIAPTNMTLVSAYVTIENAINDFTFRLRKFLDGESASSTTGTDMILDTTIAVADLNKVQQVKLTPYISNFASTPTNSRALVTGQRIGVYDVSALNAGLEGGFVLTLLFEQV